MPNKNDASPSVNGLNIEESKPTVQVVDSSYCIHSIAILDQLSKELQLKLMML